VIAPIGDEGSEIRRRSDQVLTHIIKPAAEECGYNAIRADKISEPGIITSQVIQRLIDDDLVIADLTGRNPNVFYELAIRHMVKKPIVQIIKSGESIPFDVAPTRTIHVDHQDLDSVANCKEELIRQIRSTEKDPTKVDSPISVAIDLKSLRQSENPLEKSNAEIISMLQDLRSMMVKMGLHQQGPLFSFTYPEHPVRRKYGLLNDTAFKVTEVVDVDTLKVSPNWNLGDKKGDIVIADGYNPPEQGRPDYQSAKEKLEKLILEFNGIVDLVDPIRIINGRLLCDVYIGGTNLASFFPEYQ